VTSPTMSGRLVIVGAGGFGREVLDVVEAMNAAGAALDFVGFVDDGDVDEAVVARRSAQVIGGSGLLRATSDRLTIGIGAPAVRRHLAERLDPSRERSVVLCHPAATVGGDVELGAGTVVTAGARVTTNVRLGRHVHLNLNSTVGHDCFIDNYVSVFPGATISGSVRIGEGATIGTGANVLPGVSIGEGAVVGAGAVVTRDVAPGTTVVGSPAKPVVLSEEHQE